MTSGDLKDEDCKVIKVTAGGVVAIGDLVHLVIATGKWVTCAAGDPGKFGVALDAGVDTASIRVCIWGQVEVKCTAAAIAKGALVRAGATGFVADAGVLDATIIVGTIVGTAMTAFTTSGQGTVFIGLVG